jgi:hypothetical protein
LGAGGQNNGAVMSNTIYIEECQNFMIEQLFSQLAKHDHKYAGKTIKLYCDQPDKQTKIEQILVDTYGEILFRICLNKIRICLAQQGSTIIPNRRAEFGMVQRCIPDDDKEVDQKDCGLTYEIYRKLASDWFPDKDKKTTNPPIGWVKKRWILSYLTKEWLEKYSFIEILEGIKTNLIKLLAGNTQLYTTKNITLKIPNGYQVDSKINPEPGTIIDELWTYFRLKQK